MSILNSLSCYSYINLFLIFCVALPQKTLIIILHNAFPSLPSFFSILLFVLNLIWGFRYCDWLNSNTQCIFLASILALNKVAKFHVEAHTFLYKKC